MHAHLYLKQNFATPGDPVFSAKAFIILFPKSFFVSYIIIHEISKEE
jgi:hypothetical protein